MLPAKEDGIRPKRLGWPTPRASTGSIPVGLGLDYDLLLSFRIAEFRALGYTSTSAIRKGVWKTGSVITGAGVIMSIAFAGLMMSSTAVLFEFSANICKRAKEDSKKRRAKRGELRPRTKNEKNKKTKRILC